MWALTKLGSREIALLLSYTHKESVFFWVTGWGVKRRTLIASGKEASLMYAAARFAYPRGSSGERLMASEYDLTAAGKSLALK